MAKVEHGNQLLGQMPYCTNRRSGWRISHLPPLTHTLGPVVTPLGLDDPREQHHRHTVTTALLEQLPHFDSFYQLLDSRIDDALAFSLQGFAVSVRYTFQISSQCAVEHAWDRMHSKTRNVIRGARKSLTVEPVDTPDKFVQFYDTNLLERSRKNAYERGVMRELVNAFVERKAGRLLGAYDSQGKLVAAIGLVWDNHSMYYLMSSREAGAHSGAISLLVWTAIQQALERKLTFDVDGFYSLGTCKFLEGFGGALKQRLCVERASTMFSLARILKRRLVPDSATGFSSPNL
ncbi:GNAT family N-acetyltransferase [Burkholderia sp. SRS-W-2-2016]|uniref:GNAT family N-acetyltransferase n=1 Tax=Burkholderia sp. SRS-W-2-2016 TaxID=1926878 RepID=UPI00094B4186|nr:GNAT family N-acetyltransferase [Burkholderia sp. SRS-W-2-2016]OLL31195.1 GNAT family N-acetyltransferase [Burkholderia sp. SRS-W-2-2016]